MKVKMLALLALVLLASSASEGRILSKCELKSQLVAALGGPVSTTTRAPVSVTTSAPANVTTSAPANVTTSAPANVTTIAPANVTTIAPVSVTTSAPANLTLIAQIVCSVERLSKFNTNLVTTIQVRPPSRPQQESDERPGRRPGRRSKAVAKRPGRFSANGSGSSSNSNSDSSEENSAFTTRLLGIFQLSDRVACTSRSVPSLNLCRINCNTLLDNDISNDITCLKTLLNTRNAFALSLRRIPLRECLNVNPARFFAGCA